MPKPQISLQDKKTSLANAPAQTVLSSTDLKRARAFYCDTLGLRLVNENPPEELYVEAGEGTQILIYRRSDPPRAENTVCSFIVSDIDGTVNNLRSRGVRFEEYNLPGLKTVKGIASTGTWRAAWFKDPDGNIIAVSQRSPA